MRSSGTCSELWSYLVALAETCDYGACKYMNQPQPAHGNGWAMTMQPVINQQKTPTHGFAVCESSARHFHKKNIQMGPPMGYYPPPGGGAKLSARQQSGLKIVHCPERHLCVFMLSLTDVIFHVFLSQLCQLCVQTNTWALSHAD